MVEGLELEYKLFLIGAHFIDKTNPVSPINPLVTSQHFPSDLIFQLLVVFGALCAVAAYARPRYAAGSFEYAQQHLYPTVYRQNQVTFCDCMPLN